MPGPAQPWDQPEDPRDQTVDLPRIDLAGYGNGNGHGNGATGGSAVNPREQTGEVPGRNGHQSANGTPGGSVTPPGRLEPLPRRTPDLNGDPYARPAQDARPGSLFERPPGRPPAPPAGEQVPARNGTPVVMPHPGLATQPGVTLPPASPRESEDSAPDPEVPEPGVAQARIGPVPASADPEPGPPHLAASAPAVAETPAPPSPAPVRRAEPDYGAERERSGRTHPPRPAAGSLADLRSRLDRLPDGHPSSPYEDDGLAKPSPHRLKQLELGLPAPERGQTEAVPPTYPAESQVQAREVNGRGVVADRPEDRPRQPPPPSPDQAESDHVPSQRQSRDMLERRPRTDQARRDPGTQPYPQLGQSANRVERMQASSRHSELAARLLAEARAAEGRNAFGEYGASGLTPAIRRIANGLAGGGLAPGSEANSLKSLERLSAKLDRLVARHPDRPAAEIAASICDVVRYAFAFDPDYFAEGTWLVHRKFKAQGFTLEARRNQWESPEYRGVWTRWRDPAHDLSFEVQFHTFASWDVLVRTHDAYKTITNPATLPAERARLRAQQVAAASMAKVPSHCDEIGDFGPDTR
jgi:hypothetical protein